MDVWKASKALAVEVYDGVCFVTGADGMYVLQ